MQISAHRSTANHVVIAVVCLVTYALGAWRALHLGDQLSIAAPLWAGSSLLAFCLLALPLRAGLACAIAAFFINLSIDAYFRHPVVSSMVFSALNLVEAAMAAVMARRVLGPSLRLRSLRSFLRFIGMAALPTAVVCGLLVALTGMALGVGGLGHALDRVAGHAIGLTTILSALLTLVQPRKPLTSRGIVEHGVIFAAVVIASTVMFHQDRLPVAFVLAPILSLAVFRLGPAPAALANVVMAVIALPSIAHGQGPMLLHPDWSVGFRVHLFQGVFFIAFAITLISAFSVADQARLRDLLLRRQLIARAARRRAAAANQAKTDFLATMSHEIRTPMNSMLGFAQVLLHRKDLAPDARRQLELISSAGASLLTVVNDILDFSQVESGSLTLEARPTDVERLARDTLAIVEPLAGAKGLAVRCRIEGVGAALLADELRLRQILFNLLNNAIKFTGQGCVTLNVTASPEADSQRVRFEVADTGIGIEPQMIERLFTRFTQADSSIAREYGGTGLGLAICKRLVDLMGGGIGVQSTPGEGSAFWFEILLPRSSVEPADHMVADGGVLKARVLLVDDNPMNRELGSRLLEILGCDVRAVDSGEGALAALQAHDYHLVLMDIHMPGMDGLTAARAIRALPGKTALPILAMTADVLPEQVAACRAAGMVGHVAKPINVQHLHEAISSALAA